jgi:hypothetical protein
MAKYAEGTTVSTDKSLSEIRSVLKKYGAAGFAFGEDDKAIQIAFDMKGRRIRFTVPVPDESKFLKVKMNRRASRVRTPEERRKAVEKALPQRYRALLLVIKAKLESVESGIETFDHAFLAHLILPSGETFSEWLEPQFEQIYSRGVMPPLLAANIK